MQSEQKRSKVVEVGSEADTISTIQVLTLICYQLHNWDWDIIKRTFWVLKSDINDYEFLERRENGLTKKRSLEVFRRETNGIRREYASQF